MLAIGSLGAPARKGSTIIRRVYRPVGVVTIVLAVSVSVSGCGGNGDKDPRRHDGAPPARASTAEPRVGPAVPVGRRPVAVAVGAGSVWTADAEDATVTRIDPVARKRVGAPIEVARGPRLLAAGGDAAWVASAAGTVQRLPANGGQAGRPARVTDPTGLAIGSGSVWVSSGAANAVVRLDGATGRATGAPIPVGRDPGDVAVLGSNVWVANTGDGTLSRLDASTGKTDGPPVKLVRDGQVLGLATGDGALWAAVTTDPLARQVDVLRLEPDTGKRDGAAMRVRGGVPLDLAAGLGTVWVTAPGTLLATGQSPGTGLTRLDARSGRRLGGLIRIGRSPTAVAVGSGSAWVTDAQRDVVVPVTPQGAAA